MFKVLETSKVVIEIKTAILMHANKQNFQTTVTRFLEVPNKHRCKLEFQETFILAMLHDFPLSSSVGLKYVSSETFSQHGVRIFCQTNVYLLWNYRYRIFKSMLMFSMEVLEWLQGNFSAWLTVPFSAEIVFGEFAIVFASFFPQ